MKMFILAAVIIFNFSCNRTNYDEHVNMYVVNDNDLTISCLNIDFNGNIFNKGAVTLPGGTAGQMYMQIHPNKKFVYLQLTTGSGYTYAVYTAENDGALSSYNVFANPARGTYYFGIYSEWMHFFHPNGKWHTCVNGDNTAVYFDSINQSTGELTQISSTGTNNWPNSSIIHPNGKYFYVFCFASSTYLVYAISDTGTVTAGVNTSWSGSYSPPHRCVIHPSGKFLYGVNVSDNNMWLVPVISGGADLDEANKAYYTTTSGTNFGIYMRPDGKFIYTIVGTTIYGYSINQSTGTLTDIGTYTLNTTPFMAAFYPDGNWMYVTHPSTNSVSILNVDSSTGVITFNRSITVGNNPNYIAIALVSSER